MFLRLISEYHVGGHTENTLEDLPGSTSRGTHHTNNADLTM